MRILTDLLLNFMATYPKLGGLLGLAVALLFGYVGLSMWQELQTMPQEPVQRSLTDAVTSVQAGQDQWVSIDRVTWDCDNIVPEGDRVQAVFTDEKWSVLGVATISARDVTCADLNPDHVTGVLRPMGDRYYEKLADRGFDLSRYGGAGDRVMLCTFCGPGNSLFLVIFALVMVLFGLAMYPMSLYLQRHGYG